MSKEFLVLYDWKSEKAVILTDTLEEAIADRKGYAENHPIYQRVKEETIFHLLDGSIVKKVIE